MTPPGSTSLTSGGGRAFADPGASRLRWDRLGIGASVVCAIHCLAAPILFLAAPTFAGVWAHPSSHALIALLVLPLAGTVLFRGYRVHRTRWIPAAAALGGVCILVGCVLPFLGGGAGVGEEGACLECCPRIVEGGTGAIELGWPPGSIASILGSVLLVASHLGSLASRRCCRSTHATC